MTPDQLADLLEDLAVTWRNKGATVWQRAMDWQKARPIPTDSTRGGGLQGVEPDDDRRRDMLEDAIASRYYDELVALEDTITVAATRLRHLVSILHPVQPRRGRQSTVPACVACSGPAVTRRRGMCEACYKAWQRAGMPDVSAFRRTRATA